LTRLWLERDPIARLRARLVAAHELDDASDDALTRALTSELDAAVALAESAAAPPVSSLFDDVYAELPRHLREQAAQLAAKY
jgi:TPP-dependent pyruvate/acetoin dehydrogenase alpha subunit